ncbi:SDR family oxidoreductase [Bacillus sonorensis]|uniref:Short-chain type dehydrogenase/reductase n=1 Tax=Bacillus sonorensis L12 TaxID=1274524 RepID=M5PDW5_9BACI|nr:MULTISPECIES: SDR family oxidoreductase [Bacillus]TWK75966.1 3-oxoacyl-[acyl-carrier-protein] reductase FabG [Bacillus paralicheniformis]EME74137.1 Short-chain type dehydrogenase/reductase [Bacillus sonorensis L12]MBG9913571.1 3-ketoacyl-ACP reductase [Bacillus sonorensis]MCF7619700.1 SDR family oxidoreductase [Bacillus sonorensis]MCY7858450.1 SDR family oxidoreductase [Bacillus sonorensis]
MQDVKGKTAIVTGASRGIGRTIAEQLAGLGIKVAVNYASSPEKAKEVVEGIREKGGEAVAVQADLSTVAGVKSLFTKTVEAFGKVDILINNAGVNIYKPIQDVTEEDFDKQFNLNVKGTFFACQQAMTYMEEKGRIVNFSTSVAGQMFPTYSVYAGTKGAVEQFTRQLAKEFAAKQITINAVAPGPVNTELFTEGKTEEQIEGLKKSIGLGRIGEPEDIANVIEFLVSEKSQWITGQTIRVNGGFI